ncbi:hypothetical protein KUTeg_003765 [Tegillarca granosa]|uniref:Uncharacterized protein n=1 Tax=Tegillarca granosa TaxID=220873 RepID=A0ABQ9FN09_TEGGR|nr:hypothetical protein KUTeg_003765 [Tegillarca granosa]
MPSHFVSLKVSLDKRDNSSLGKINLSFEKLKPDDLEYPSLICANFDGASVNLGQKGGVIAKIREVIPNVLGLHCVAHKLELAALDANKHCKYVIEQFEQTVKGIFNFYHYSPKRRREVKEVADVLDVTFSHMSDVKQVRWMSSKYRAIEALQKNYPAIVTHLEHNSASGNRADDANKAKGYLKDLRSLKFLKHLYFLLDYLPVLTNLSKQFQLEDLLIIEIPDLVEAAVLKLNALKTTPGKFMKIFCEQYNVTERKFGDIKLSDTGKLSPVDFKTDKDIHAFLDSGINYIKQRFQHLSEPPLSYFEIFNFHKWPLSRSDLSTYGQQDLTNLLNDPSISPFFSDEEKDGIISEWVPVKYNIQNGSFLNPDVALSFAQQTILSYLVVAFYSQDLILILVILKESNGT